MRLPEGAITYLASEGRITLQVPPFVIGEISRMIDYPDEWFHYVKMIRENCYRPVFGREQGYLHLTRAGWEANREALREAFESSPSTKTWQDFERYVETYFYNMGQAIQAEIQKAQQRINELQNLVY